LEAALPQQGVERNDRQWNADSDTEDVIVIVVCTTTTRLDCTKRKKMVHSCSERVTMIVNTNVWEKAGAGWEELGSQDYQDAGGVFLAPFHPYRIITDQPRRGTLYLGATEIGRRDGSG
jgi:phosphoribosylformimino-5-aminoimidazole carboxamide ribonucleotide (ProFAR) isomerase